MPQAVPIIIAAAGSGISITGGVVAFSFANAAIGAAIATVGALASHALAPDPPSGPDFSDFASQARSRTQTIRQSVVPRRKPVGTVITGTILNYYAATSNKKYHHMVMTVCDGPIDSFGTVWVNDEPINQEDIDGNGNVIRGRFKDKLRLKFHLGSDSQTADSDLISEVADLDTNFRGRGVAYIYARVQWNRDILPNGLPNFRVVVNAEETDPRTATTGFTDNAAIAWRSYMIDEDLGMGAHSAEASDINSTEFNAAANVCDEIAATNDKAATGEGADTSEDTLTLSNDRLPFFTGDRVQISTSGTLPGGLSGGTDYYVIAVNHARASADSPVKIKLATSLVNARAGTAVSLSSTGSGTHTVTKDGEPRYRASGIIDVASTPARIVKELLSSMVGTATYTGGKWVLLPGTWNPGTAEYDEGDLRGSISGATRFPKDERYNRVRGLFASPYNDGELTEYPVVVSSTLLAADNNKPEWDTFDQPYSAAPTQAQRNAGQRLKRYRTGEVRFESVFSLKAVLENKNRTGDVIKLTNERRGWSGKYFEIRSLSLAVGQTDDGTPVLTCPVSLAATLETDYDWDPATEETDVNPSARFTGTGIFDVDTPTLGTIASGTSHLFVKKDGTVVSRIYVPWTSITDELILGGGEVQVRYRQTGEADTSWLVRRQDDPTLDFVYLDPVEDDVEYDIQIRAINGLGVSSDWSATTTHTVLGKSALPSDISTLSAQQNGNVVTFRWTPITDLDRAGAELRFMGAPFVWEDAIEITKETKGTLITNAALPPGTWVVGIKAVDTSGNLSQNATTTTITVVNENDIISTQTAHPRWPGTRNGYIKHDVSGRLVPESNTLASAMTDEELWDQMVFDPVVNPTYEAKEIDLGFDSDGVRVWSDTSVALGAGESGSAAEDFQIDYRDDAESYDGFENWNIGTADFRFLKGRIRGDNSNGAAYVSAFEVNADVEERSERAKDVSISIGGISISFSTQFHQVPIVEARAEPVSGAARHTLIENVTKSGFDVTIVDRTDSDTGGTLEYWEASGP